MAKDEESENACHKNNFARIQSQSLNMEIVCFTCQNHRRRLKTNHVFFFPKLCFPHNYPPTTTVSPSPPLIFPFPPASFCPQRVRTEQTKRRERHRPLVKRHPCLALLLWAGWESPILGRQTFSVTPTLFEKIWQNGFVEPKMAQNSRAGSVQHCFGP